MPAVEIMDQKEAGSWFEQFSRILVLHLISVNCRLTPVINQTLEMLQTRISILWALSPFITSCWGIFDQFLLVLLCFNQHDQPGTGSSAAEAVDTSSGGSMNVLSLLSAHSHICPPKPEVSGPHPRALKLQQPRAVLVISTLK